MLIISITLSTNGAFADQYTMDAVATAGGAVGKSRTIAPAGQVAVVKGEDARFTIATATGFRVANVTINWESVGADTQHTITIGAISSLEASKVLVKASAGSGGTVSPNGTLAVTSGNDQTFNFQPASGYQIDKVLYNGKSVGNAASYTATNITNAATLTVSFKPIRHTVTASTAPSGKIAPSGNGPVLSRKSQKFISTPPRFSPKSTP